MSQQAWERAMGMRGYRGSPAECDDRRAGIKVGGEVEWLAAAPGDDRPTIARITAITVDNDGDPWFDLEIISPDDDHKPVRVERDEIRSLPA